MNEILLYIESYFENQLSESEKLVFEQRIMDDEVFAKEVAFYIGSRQALRQELIEKKEQAWTKSDKQEETPVVNIKKSSPVFRMIAIAAVAIVVLGLAWALFVSKSISPQQLASKYTEAEFETIGATMDGSRDSLQQGIEAYNEKDFITAEKLFTAVYTAHPEQTDALKYSGIVSLTKKDYDQAISRFQLLANRTELFANPGKFYQAIALLQRNKSGDEAAAKKLLEEVVQTNQEGSKQAKEWLQKF